MFPNKSQDAADNATLFDKHTIETPEQVRLDFPVAGIGSRFLALAIDTLVQAGCGIVVLILLVILARNRIFTMTGASSTWALAIVGVIGFLLLYGYFAIFEIVWRGQTPGKRAIGIRVVKDSGRPLTAGETIGRNLMRIVDQLPGFYGIGMVAALVSAQNKRLGDMVAGSVVVREAALAAIKPVWQTEQAAFDPSRRVLGAGLISVDDLALIDAFLHRRNDLSADVRSRMAAQILVQLRQRVTIPNADGMSSEAILEAMAYERRSVGGAA